MNYDPNMTSSGRMARQRVRLTFGEWHFRSTVEVDVGGNCTGLTVIDSAVDTVYGQLNETASGIPAIYLEGDGNETLECADDEDEGEDFLKEMLVAAEILSIEEVKQ